MEKLLLAAVGAIGKTQVHLSVLAALEFTNSGALDRNSLKEGRFGGGTEAVGNQ